MNVPMRKYRYLVTFTGPVIVFIALSSHGIYTWLPLFFFFGFLPVLELFLQPDNRNASSDELQTLSQEPFFDRILYLIVPVQLAMLVYFFTVITEPGLSSSEFIGRIVSMGLMCGMYGINVGHELGHRSSRFEQFLGEILLLTSLQTHFLPYHNAGHHHNVATPQDPATARKNHPVYLFWFTSQLGSYFQAWQIEARRMHKKGKPFFSLSNRMLGYTFAHIIVLLVAWLAAGITGLLAFIAASAVGIILLETVNYIEHYGLMRKQNADGRYERVQLHHSWNSDHVLGRIFLFELSRHSDHHYKASKKYQVLESYDQSPRMPTGYPGMMLLSLVPPIWFYVMNRRLDNLPD